MRLVRKYLPSSQTIFQEDGKNYLAFSVFLAVVSTLPESRCLVLRNRDSCAREQLRRLCSAIIYLHVPIQFCVHVRRDY